MSKKQKNDTQIKVRYPIGIKLTIIIAFLLLIALGTITALDSYMISQDLRITAEDNNFSINRRSATAAETALQTTRSNALMLLNSLNAAGWSFRSVSPLTAQILDFYFEQNRDVAAIVINGSAGAERSLVNEDFFAFNEADPGLIDTWNGAGQRTASPEETVLLNAAPVFGIPLLAMTFPWKPASGGGNRAVTVLFSPEELSEVFSGSINASYMVNHAGDILVHPDSTLVMAGANMERDLLIEMLRKSPERNFQTLYTNTAGSGYFGAWRKLSLADAAVLTTVESRLIYEGIRATTRRNIYLNVLVLFIVILFIWFFSKSISMPLRRIAEAAGKIEVGEFDVALTEKTHDEIGLLSESFKRMGKALLTFSRFTNQEITRQAMLGTLALGGEPRMVTLLFTDIRSFTMMSEMLEPWEVVEFLNSYMTRMIACIDKTGGTVDKFMGDAIMAHWGAVTIMESPAVNAMNAVKAALAMRGALRQFNAGRDGSIKQPRIRIGCGINSGPVVAGQIGSDKRMEYTVIGDTVNMASRTEELNKSFLTDILITENTWEYIREKVIVEEMPTTKVKGKKEPVRIFAVINLRAEAGEKQKRPVNLGEVRAMLGLGAPNLKQLILEMEREERKQKNSQ